MIMHTFGDRICFIASYFCRVSYSRRSIDDDDNNDRRVLYVQSLATVVHRHVLSTLKVHAPRLNRVRAMSWSCQLYVRLQWEPLSLAIAVIATAVTYLAALCWFISFTPHSTDNEWSCSTLCNAPCTHTQCVFMKNSWRTAQSITRNNAEHHQLHELSVSERIFCTLNQSVLNRAARYHPCVAMFNMLLCYVIIIVHFVVFLCVIFISKQNT